MVLNSGTVDDDDYITYNQRENGFKEARPPKRQINTRRQLAMEYVINMISDCNDKISV